MSVAHMKCWLARRTRRERLFFRFPPEAGVPRVRRGNSEVAWNSVPRKFWIEVIRPLALKTSGTPRTAPAWLLQLRGDHVCSTYAYLRWCHVRQLRTRLLTGTSRDRAAYSGDRPT